MPQPATRRPSLPPPTPRAARRRLIVGCVAVAAALGLAACGTASGALQSQNSPSGQPPITITPATDQPTGSPVATVVPTPDSDGASASAAPPAVPKPRTPKAPTGTATATTGVPATPAGSTTHPAAPATPTAQPAPPAPPAPPTPVKPGTVIGSTASGGRTVALTFDDGPGPATGQILDLLAQYKVKATFCEIGQNAAANPALVKRVLAAGHRLCDHSVHHPQPFAKLPHDQAAYEISAAKDMIVQAGGPGTRVTWFRAPGGGFNADNEQITASLGMSSLAWSVDPRDWSRPGVPAIVSTVQKQLKPGGVILMHDGGGDRSQTVAALKELLPWLVAQGYTFDFPAA
ncbi:peptidoglycan/xylan/chitin deacetylase (PgdA/CDA1 family) [Kitasatospora sp. MAA19]|uniref:polysaccharide deacetylase family protein n=1 Tax=Kitasatospora sp. MAA19 TaxID=3035090 RepID=UPI002474DB4C|nr:polysaccharide deacetylase family protein [Kitasatospora sp. MAA19]MDH6704083.1 peptidoglycan/xylan/chitin deacetylase (PgdA/CDA1 family) [Kitasatospora sp. MAA19]